MFAGFILFVLNLKKEHYKVQFSLVNIIFICEFVSIVNFIAHTGLKKSLANERVVFALTIPCMFSSSP